MKIQDSAKGQRLDESRLEKVGVRAHDSGSS